MRLHRVTLRNYRGVTDCTVEFPDSGVTVIEGDNEIGKTSIPEAVDLILNELDSSTKKAVRAIRPVHRDKGPEVEVEITSGDYRFTYSKRWHRNARTELVLTAPSREQLTSRQAHERVEQILAETLDRDLWRALSIEQGTELGQPRLNVPSLGQALDQAAGGSPAAESHDALWYRVCRERESYWTKTGRESQERKSQADEVERARADCAELEDQITAIDDDAEQARRLAEAEPGLAETRDEAEREEVELKRLWDQGNSLRATVEQRTAARDAALAQHHRAVDKRRRREERIDEVAADRDAVSDLEAEAERAAQARALAAERKAETAGEAVAARDALGAAQNERDLACGDRDYFRNLIEKDQLSERLERVRKAEQVLSEAEEILASTGVDDDLVDEIEKANLEVAGAEAALRASAAVVRTTALSALGARIDGEQVNLEAGESHQSQVTADWELEVPDVMRVSLQAASRSSDLATELNDARTHHDRLCSQGGVRNLAEARQSAEDRKDAERRKKSAQTTIAQDLRDLTPDVLESKVGGLASRTAAYAEERAESPPLPDGFDSAKLVASDSEESLNEARDKCERCLEEDEQAGEVLQEAEKDTAVNAAKLGDARAVLEQAERRLEDDRREQSDEALAEVLAASAAGLEEAAGALAEAEGELQAHDPDTIEARLANARDVKTRAERELTANRRRQDELRGSLEARGGDGLQDQLNDSESAREQAEREQQRTESRAQAAELLYRTFKRHRSDAHERYIDPFKQKIEQLGRFVFGTTFEVELDPDLRVARRTLEGVTLDAEKLSVGAREQIGVICRLACAAIVSPNGGGAPVVIDDALGWSDPARLRKMGAAMSKASRDSQVIVLTCTPGRYAHVGNAKVIRLPNGTE